MDDLLTILQGDALERLRGLPEASVQCCVTSLPYWGLRDYGFCSCRKGRVQDESSTLAGTQAGTPNHFAPPDSECGLCNGSGRVGGTEGQIGLESTPEEYVAHLVEAFREVHRVLKRDGTLWLNLGDSYASPSTTVGVGGSAKQNSNRGSVTRPKPGLPTNVKAKDLIGIPWMVAFALRACGWYLRSDVIWSKPNPMPESVTDRPTKAHEYVFLLAKAERYFYDAESIKEPVADSTRADHRTPELASRIDRGYPGLPNRGSWNLCSSDNRNKRSVWSVNSSAFSEAHFATYPPALIKPCILAGTKPGDVVLDPFAGSGTTGMVALELGRKAVLIELNPQYIKLIEQRCNVTPGLALA